MICTLASGSPKGPRGLLNAWSAFLGKKESGLLPEQQTSVCLYENYLTVQAGKTSRTQHGDQKMAQESMDRNCMGEEV